jgi:hypothetical protein
VICWAVEPFAESGGDSRTGGLEKGDMALEEEGFVLFGVGF